MILSLSLTHSLSGSKVRMEERERIGGNETTSAWWEGGGGGGDFPKEFFGALSLILWLAGERRAARAAPPANVHNLMRIFCLIQ